MTAAAAAPTLPPATGVASLTVRAVAAAVGTYGVVLTNPPVAGGVVAGEFEVTAVTGPGGQRLVLQPAYSGR